MGSSTSALCGSDKDVTAPKRPQSGTSNRPRPLSPSTGRKEEPVVQAVSPLRVEPVEEARVPDLEQTEDETKPVEKIVDEKKAEPVSLPNSEPKIENNENNVVEETVEASTAVLPTLREENTDLAILNEDLNTQNLTESDKNVMLGEAVLTVDEKREEVSELKDDLKRATTEDEREKLKQELEETKVELEEAEKNLDLVAQITAEPEVNDAPKEALTTLPEITHDNEAEKQDLNDSATGVASEENVANEGVAVTVEALEEVVIEKVEIPASEEVALNAAPEPPTTEEEIRGVYSAEPENKVPDVVIENGLQVIESAASQEETATENENPPSADKVEQPEQTLAADAEVETENTDVPLADEPQVENELEAPVSDEPVLSTNEDSEVSAALDQPENEPEAPSKVDNDKPENEDRDPSPPEQPEVPESTESTEEPTVGSQSAEVKDDATEQPEQAKDSSEKPEETQAESAGDNELSAKDNENSENQRDPTPEAA